MLEMIRTITGPSDIDSAFAQATQFLPGHYLTRHLDDPAGERRRFARLYGVSPLYGDRTWAVSCSFLPLT
jgi:Rps23 Pro-64 3,4-dihydroxylase Tpa1-like proline 4-hydroxylase